MASEAPPLEITPETLPAMREGLKELYASFLGEGDADVVGNLQHGVKRGQGKGRDRDVQKNGPSALKDQRARERLGRFHGVSAPSGAASTISRGWGKMNLRRAAS